MVSGKKPMKDGKPCKVVKTAKQKRPNNFWAPFTAWWRAHYDETGHRASAAAIRDWYAENARGAWPGDQLPGIEDLLNVAKGMRTKAQVQSYFRKYRRSIKSRQDDSADTDVDAGEEPPPDLGTQQMPFPALFLGGPSQGHILTAALEAAMKTDIGPDASRAASGFTAQSPASFTALGLQPSAASLAAALQYQVANSQFAGQLPALLASPAAQLQLASLLFNRQALPAAVSAAAASTAAPNAPDVGQQPLLSEVSLSAGAPRHGGLAGLAAAAAQSSAPSNMMQGPIAALLAAISQPPRVHSASALPSQTPSAATAAQAAASAPIPIVYAPSRKSSVRHPQLPWGAARQGQMAADPGATNLGAMAEIADYIGQTLGMDSPVAAEGANSLAARHNQQPSAGNPRPGEDISEPSALGMSLGLLGGPQFLEGVEAADSMRPGSERCLAGERLAEDKMETLTQAAEAGLGATPSCAGTSETDVQHRARSSSAAVASPAERGGLVFPVPDTQRTTAEPANATPLSTACIAACAFPQRPTPAGTDLVHATLSDAAAQGLGADQGQSPRGTLTTAGQALAAAPAVLAFPPLGADQEIGTQHLTGDPSGSKQPLRARPELGRPRPPTHFLRDPAACSRMTTNAAGRQFGDTPRTGPGLLDVGAAVAQTTGSADTAAGKRSSWVPGGRVPYPAVARNAALEDRGPPVFLQATRVSQPALTGAVDDDDGEQRAKRAFRIPFETRGFREPAPAGQQYGAMRLGWPLARSIPGALAAMSGIPYGYHPRPHSDQLPPRHAGGHPVSQVTSSITTLDATSSGLPTDEATSSEDLEHDHERDQGLGDTAYGNGNGYQRPYGNSFIALPAPPGHYMGGLHDGPASKRRRSGLGADVGGPPSSRNQPIMDREEEVYGWRGARDPGASDDHCQLNAACDDAELQGAQRNRATLHRAPSRQDRGGTSNTQLPRFWPSAEDQQPASRHSSASQVRFPFASARYGRSAAHGLHEDTGEEPAPPPAQPAARNTLHAHLANIYMDSSCLQTGGASQHPARVPPLDSGSALKPSNLVAMKYMNWATTIARPQGLPAAQGPPGLPLLWRSLVQSDLTAAYARETNGVGLDLEDDGMEGAAERYLAWVLKQEAR